RRPPSLRPPSPIAGWRSICGRPGAAAISPVTCPTVKERQGCQALPCRYESGPPRILLRDRGLSVLGTVHALLEIAAPRYPRGAARAPHRVVVPVRFRGHRDRPRLAPADRPHAAAHY